MSAVYVAWRGSESDAEGWRPVGRLSYEDGVFRYCYTQGARKPGFRPFEGLRDLNRVHESTELFPLFANRLMSRSRPDYLRHLEWSGLPTDKTPDPIVVLGVTEGIRQTDAVEVFPCPAPAEDGCYVNRFFAHGMRWFPEAARRIARLKPGDPLALVPHPQNPVDPYAVALRTVEEPTDIGYVPRYLARDMRQVISGCDPDFVRASVVRVNLDAPWQNRALCSIRACWPSGFLPCDGEDFRPIPSDVAALPGA